MATTADLIIRAEALLESRTPPIQEGTGRVREIAGPLVKASIRLKDQSIEALIGPTKASIGENRSRYYTGEGSPPPEAEYDSAVWVLLTEEEARGRVEKWAGVTFEDLLAPWTEVKNETEALRREVLACLEPVARSIGFSDGLAEIQELRRKKINCTAAEYINSTLPSHVILDLDEVDKVRGTPRHLSNLGWAIAAQITADRVEETVVELGDLTVRVRNESHLSVSGESAQDDQRDSRSSDQRDDDDGHTSSIHIAVVLTWIALGTAGLMAAFDANWFGNGDREPVYKAVAVALLAALTYQLCRESLGWEGRRWGAAASIFVAVFSLGFAFFGD